MEIKQERERETPLKGADWVNEYNSMLDRAKARQNELNKQLSEYDKQQQDILHYIEMKKCDAITSSKLMKELKDIRAKRRLIKDEYAAICSINCQSKKSNYKANETYVFKTNIVIDLLEDK